jgi:DNA-binding Lrp family transcriptional regulator
MSNRKSNVPPTSREAFHSLDPEKINEIHKRILEGLKLLQTGTYEDLAKVLKLKPERVWRRLSELHRAGMIYRTGDRKILSSGRAGFVWAITGSEIKPVTTEKALPGKSVADYSREIIQPSLF